MPDQRAAPGTQRPATERRRAPRLVLVPRFVAAATVAVAILFSATSALAANPTLSLSPSSASVGDVVTISGSDFPAHIWGQLVLDGAPSAMPRFRTDTAGSFSQSFVVDTSIAPGRHLVAAIEDGPSPAFNPSGPQLATASFEVLAGSVTPTPTTSAPGPTPTATSATPTATPSGAPTASPTASGTLPSGSVDHVFVIELENHSFSQIVGSAAAPYINSLIPTGALATNFHALTHPSLPNYLALTGGSTFGVTNDCLPTQCPVAARNVGDALDAAGASWKSYLEAMPSPCYLSDTGTYRAHHNPFVYYNDVRQDGARCALHDVPYSSLAADLATAATTPSFSFIVPDNCHNMHDCSIGAGDSWLSTNVQQIMASPAWASGRSLLVITFDEDNGGEGNRVMTLFVGPAAKSGYESPIAYNHYSLLRTVEDLFGASPLTNNDGNASPMLDLLR